MPVEKSRELRDLVTESLREKGVLGKVQAEIRASVFLALEEHDAFKDRNPFLNNKLKDFLTTDEGLVVFSLVRELLEFFNLEFTYMVLDPETHAGIDFNYLDKIKLAKELSLKNSDDQPLLAQLVNLLKQKNVPNEKSDSCNDFPLPVNGLNGSSDHIGIQDKAEIGFSGLKESLLSSLSGIPPLNLKVDDKASAKEEKHFSLSYDESNKTKEGTESEVEEDLSNEAQSEQQDDNTVDLSVSKSSGHGDYQEDI